MILPERGLSKKKVLESYLAARQRRFGRSPPASSLPLPNYRSREFKRTFLSPETEEELVLFLPLPLTIEWSGMDRWNWTLPIPQRERRGEFTFCAVKEMEGSWLPWLKGEADEES